MPEPLILLDGRIVPARAEPIYWTEPGLRQGYGLFETIRLARGRAFLAGLHCQRMTEGAARLAIQPWLHPISLARAVDRLVAESRTADGSIRLFMLPGSPPPGEEGSDPAAYSEQRATAERTILEAAPHGAAPRGNSPAAGSGSMASAVERSTRARYLGLITPGRTPPPDSIGAILSPDLRDPRSPLVGIKTISYAAERLLLGMARRQGAGEALRRNLEGRLTEGSRSNLFLIEGDLLITPPLSEGLLAGVTRWFILKTAKDSGFEPREDVVPVERLLAADEAFVASTLRGIVPLVALDGEAIGSGNPGPGSVRLRRALERHISGESL